MVEGQDPVVTRWLVAGELPRGDDSLPIQACGTSLESYVWRLTQYAIPHANRPATRGGPEAPLAHRGEVGSDGEAVVRVPWELVPARAGDVCSLRSPPGFSRMKRNGP